MNSRMDKVDNGCEIVERRVLLPATKQALLAFQHSKSMNDDDDDRDDTNTNVLL